MGGPPGISAVGLHPHPTPPPFSQQEDAGEELGTSGIRTSVTWGGDGWVAAASYAAEDAEPTWVRPCPLPAALAARVPKLREKELQRLIWAAVTPARRDFAHLPHPLHCLVPRSAGAGAGISQRQAGRGGNRPPSPVVLAAARTRGAACVREQGATGRRRAAVRAAHPAPRVSVRWRHATAQPGGARWADGTLQLCHCTHAQLLLPVTDDHTCVACCWRHDHQLPCLCRHYAVPAGPGRMPRVWALAQLPRGEPSRPFFLPAGPAKRSVRHMCACSMLSRTLWHKTLRKERSPAARRGRQEMRFVQQRCAGLQVCRPATWG